MIRFTDAETEFLESREECRIATVNGSMPHVKPVSYIFDGGMFHVGTDYETRTVKNIRSNPATAIVVDVYKPEDHAAVCVQGTARIMEGGKEYGRIYGMFYEKFRWVRDDPWDEGEAPFLRIIPASKTSWGIKH